MNVEVRFNGSLKYDITKYRDKILQEAKDLIEDLIISTEIEATRSAPRFISITKAFENGGLTGRVGVIGRQMADMGTSDPNNLAAYIEFGTGLSAREILSPYPQWVKDIAMDYFVSGKGTLVGKPYLFNNFLKNLAIFEKELEQLIKEQEH